MKKSVEGMTDEELILKNRSKEDRDWELTRLRLSNTQDGVMGYLPGTHYSPPVYACII
jgi:hypothetical protein